MQHDEVCWQSLRHNHCSFMVKTTTVKLCRNQYNVTGICNRSSCPLANSRYATILEHDDWERVKLPRNYVKALEVIDKNTMYWSKLLVHKTKQRLTKMTQMRIRMRKLALKTREKIMTTPRKEKKREARREEKAEKAAVLDKITENELLERLKKGVHDEIYNYPLDKYNEFLDKEGLQPASEDEEDEYEIEYVEGYESLEEEDDMEDFGGLDIDESLADYDDVGMDDDTDEDKYTVAIDHSKRSKDSAFASRKAEKGHPDAKSKKKARVLVEVENEDGDERLRAVY